MSTAFNSPQIPAMGLVAGLEEEDRLLLGDYGEFLPVQEGQVLIKEGEQQDALYFVISGTLHVHTEKDGHALLVTEIEPGASIGEINIFDPGIASATVTAKSFTQVWRASREDFESFMSAYPGAGSQIMSALLTEMSRRIRHMNDKLAAVETEAIYQSFWD